MTQSLFLYNSLTSKIDHLELLPNQDINLYLCGPTVYDHIHIGNLRPVIIFDVIHRLLLQLKVKVKYIQNITDIDDKIIAKAQNEKKTEKEISEYYAEEYFINLINFNILLPSHSPKVTNYVLQIQEFIKSLLEKGNAYQQEGEVFFRVSTLKEYGKLSGQNLKKLKNVREVAQLAKEDSKDFVIWKKTKEGAAWDSPWVKGRPGWHTECVVFIEKLFHSRTIDIHGGGNDLLFPHHENERAQFLANNNKKELSKLWLHIAHVNWSKEKMSKSLGNVILAKHFYQKYGTNVLRYLILNSHYNQTINFDEQLIRQGQDYEQKIKNFLKRLCFYLYIQKIETSSLSKEKKSEVQKEIISHLLNNLNTIKVFYILEQSLNFLNKFLDKPIEEKNQEFLIAVSDVYFILNILGFKFDLHAYDSQIKELIKKWEALKKEGHYSEADKIRNELQKMNIV